MPRLDVPLITKPILENFDGHVRHFVQILDTVNCVLTYDDESDDIRTHLVDKTVYACSVRCGSKTIKNILPVMIGSRLDLAIRFSGQRSFENGLPPPPSQPYPFQELDIGTGFFIVNGCLRQLPYFFTNDSTNTHVVKESSNRIKKFNEDEQPCGHTVRCYTYDANDRGKELTFYAPDTLMVVRNDGTKSTHDGDRFFDHCPFETNQRAYMLRLLRDSFDIDHLGNKIFVSPGHVFVKLFTKYLLAPIRDGDWDLVRSRLNIVHKSIESGALLHVLSRKTFFFKEGGSTGKMAPNPKETHREIGVDGRPFTEKTEGCYRPVSAQTYPLNPYILYLIVRQISSKVKQNNVPAYPINYLGFLCILGIWETKNVGRTNMMCRNTRVSTEPELDVYALLRIEQDHRDTGWFVVVNEACIAVTRTCFHRIESEWLDTLKRRLKTVECFRRWDRFLYVRCKTGLLFKHLCDDVWVTPNDEMYWARRLLDGVTDKDALIDTFGFDYVTGWHVDLNPYFNHNAFPRNVLGFNALKNAVLATDSRYMRYFLDTLSAYTPLSPQHCVVLEPVNDGVSSHFALRVPKVALAYASFEGCTQEDCIVMRDDLKAFDCWRFYTLRVNFQYAQTKKCRKRRRPGAGMVVFHSVRGNEPFDDTLLGTLVCPFGDPLDHVESQSIHVRTVRIDASIVQIHFNKKPFRVLQYDLTSTRLAVCVDQFHPSTTGDKLCSFHGQKGVIFKSDRMPRMDETVPDLIVSPYGLFRMTMGQILEGCGVDAKRVRNADGRLIPGASAMLARNFYFLAGYLSSEHYYVPDKCVVDKILCQAVKGRSRGGGMRLGNMEVLNGLRANGIANCFEEKFFEHGDRTKGGIPKSVQLICEDAKFFKCLMDFEMTAPCVQEM